MAEEKNDGRGIIKFGYVFVDDDELSQILSEGCGVVVIRRQGGGYAYFGEPYEKAIPRGSEVLHNYLTGAKSQYGDEALLAVKENGLLVFLTKTESQPVMPTKAPARIPSWMLDKRFRFGKEAANRR